MALATVDTDGLPNVRMVLLKGADGEESAHRGFVFYTNLDSAKGSELAHQPRAALLFHWKSLRRQIRIRGSITAVSETEADSYFESRPRGSQIGAWASDQSRTLSNRQILRQRVASITEKYDGQDVPRPQHWSGFRLIPIEIEFWQNGEHRLHDRIVFRRTAETLPWTKARLYP